MGEEPSFAIPARPRRRYSRSGGVEYEGETVFHLEPAVDRTEAELAPVVEDLLDDGPYRRGSFLDLPMVLWLVRDEGTGDVFRVAVRNGEVRLHVLPATEPPGLQRFHERLVARTDWDWRVETTASEP